MSSVIDISHPTGLKPKAKHLDEVGEVCVNMDGVIEICRQTDTPEAKAIYRAFRRPGSERTRIPVRLPAERQRLGAFSNYQPLTRVSRLSADTAGRREVVTDRIRVRRGPAFGGIWKNVRTFRLLNPARISFLGSARVQAGKQTSRRIADRFQVDHSLRDAPASEMQEITEGIPDERKPTARDGNLTARERKNAC